jgi:hypothetical protein
MFESIAVSAGEKWMNKQLKPKAKNMLYHAAPPAVL